MESSRCPLLDGSCSRGTCYTNEPETEDFYGCGEECCGEEEEEETQPTCGTCTSHRYDFALSMGLDARYGRRERRSSSPGAMQQYPGYPKQQPVVSYPGYPKQEIIREGREWAKTRRQSRYRRPIAFLPNVVDAISGLLVAPRRRRYRKWYPKRYYPLYINGNTPNPDLGGWGMEQFPPDSGVNALPYFKNLPLNFHFGDFMRPDQVLSAREEDMLNQALDTVNDQLLALRSATRFSEWTRRGFKIVPDLRSHRFIWVFAGVLPRTTITEFLGNVKLSCAACGGHGGELKELAKLTHESIVFDVRGKYGDEIFKGFYISKEGHVFAYHMAHDHQNPQLSRKETISELLPQKKVSPEEMKRLIGLMAKLQSGGITHERRHTGPIWIDGFYNYTRVHIYGDDDSLSQIAEELKDSIMAIVR